MNSLIVDLVSPFSGYTVDDYNDKCVGDVRFVMRSLKLCITGRIPVKLTSPYLGLTKHKGEKSHISIYYENIDLFTQKAVSNIMPLYPLATGVETHAPLFSLHFLKSLPYTKFGGYCSTLKILKFIGMYDESMLYVKGSCMYYEFSGYELVAPVEAYCDIIPECVNCNLKETDELENFANSTFHDQGYTKDLNSYKRAALSAINNNWLCRRGWSSSNKEYKTYYRLRGWIDCQLLRLTIKNSNSPGKRLNLLKKRFRLSLDVGEALKNIKRLTTEKKVIRSEIMSIVPKGDKLQKVTQVEINIDDALEELGQPQEMKVDEVFDTLAKDGLKEVEEVIFVPLKTELVVEVSVDTYNLRIVKRDNNYGRATIETYYDIFRLYLSSRQGKFKKCGMDKTNFRDYMVGKKPINKRFYNILNLLKIMYQGKTLKRVSMNSILKKIKLPEYQNIQTREVFHNHCKKNRLFELGVDFSGNNYVEDYHNMIDKIEKCKKLTARKGLHLRDRDYGVLFVKEIPKSKPDAYMLGVKLSKMLRDIAKGEFDKGKAFSKDLIPKDSTERAPSFFSAEAGSDY